MKYRTAFVLGSIHISDELNIPLNGFVSKMCDGNIYYVKEFTT